MDNNRSTRCHCERCQAAFREYVAARLTTAEIERNLGASKLSDLRLNPDADPLVLESLVTTDRPANAPRLRPGVDLYHVKLTWEFWTDSKVEFLRELKSIGTNARGGEFHIFANTTAYSKGAHEPGRVAAVATFNQSEENGADTGAHSGLVPPEIGGPSGAAHNRRAFEYKCYQSFEHGMRVGMLTRPGHGLPAATRLAIDQNPQTAELSIAESAAFGGGGGYKMDLRWDHHGTVQRWRRFFVEHRALYENTVVWAPLGIIAFTEQFFCGLDKTHQEEVREISARFLEQGTLFDLIHERTFSLERLQRFRGILVPRGVRSLSAMQLEVFRRYSAQGGILVLADDDFAAMDERCRPRPVRERSVDGARRLPPGASSGGAVFAAVSDVIGRDVGIVRNAAGQIPSGVGVNAFTTASGDVILHLVNYNVPLGQGRIDPPIALRNLIVTIPLPPGWQAASARGFSAYPAEELAISCEVREAEIGLRIPSLTLYKVIRISRGGGAK